jgi:intein/homing endonuclease
MSKQTSVVWSPLPGTSQELAMACTCDSILLTGGRGGGKMQPLTEKILTRHGWKTLKDIKVGDKVVTPRGNCVKVTHKYDHKNKLVYKLTFDDGASCRAGAEHLWKYKVVGSERKSFELNWHVNDTSELYRLLLNGRVVLVPTIDNAVKNFNKFKYEIDFYLLGLLLGDGSFQTYGVAGRRGRVGKISSVLFTTVDPELKNYIAGFGFTEVSDTGLQFYLPKHNDSTGVHEAVEELGLALCRSKDKFVPSKYLKAPCDNRLALLQGLMDTDGTARNGSGSTFTTISLQLALDVQYLARSLGAKATVNGPYESKYKGVKCQDHYDVHIQPGNKFSCFRLSRKLNKLTPYMHKDLCRRLVSIVPDGEEDCACIALDDPEHLYITSDFIVTHNSNIQLMRFRARVGLGYGAFWRGVIFDIEYKDMDDLIAQSQRLFLAFEDGAKFLKASSAYKWTWPTGEELLFRTGSEEDHYWSYHGQEFCLAVGQLVCTDKGNVPIEVLEPGDSVLTAQGYRKVTKVFPKVMKDCVKVKTYTDSHEYRGEQIQSRQHRFLRDVDRWMYIEDAEDCWISCETSFGKFIPVTLFTQRFLDENTEKGIYYADPYTYTTFLSEIEDELGFVTYEECGKYYTIDIEVEDTHSYITPCGLLSLNCYIGANELTKQHSPKFLDMMMSCNRSSFTPEKDSPVDRATGKQHLLPPIPLEFVATTNPFGVGRNWVKKRYIDPAPYGRIVRTNIEIIDPKTRKPLTVERTQVALFSSYVENIYLPHSYIAQLHQQTDKNKKKAWLYGSWDIAAGGMFDDLWRDDVHIVERFPIPAHWYVDRAFDWGSTHPFAVGWYAEATGEEVKLMSGAPYLVKGQPFAPKAGSLIMIAEWYGSAEEDWGSNKGLKLAPSEVAKGIVECETWMKANKWVNGTIYPGPADNEIHNVRDVSSDTIAKKMLDHGVEWERSDKSDGSIVNGYQLLRERLKAAVSREGQAFYIMRPCKAAIQFLPSLPPHPTIPDKSHPQAEDHCVDQIRYRILKSNNRLAGAIRVRTASG